MLDVYAVCYAAWTNMNINKNINMNIKIKHKNENKCGQRHGYGHGHNHGQGNGHELRHGRRQGHLYGCQAWTCHKIMFEETSKLWTTANIRCFVIKQNSSNLKILTVKIEFAQVK
jgi:hypothetical protein